MLSFCDSHHKIYNFFEELLVANPAGGVVALLAALFRNDTVFLTASAAPRTARWHDAQLIGRKFTCRSSAESIADGTSAKSNFLPQQTSIDT